MSTRSVALLLRTPVLEGDRRSRCRVPLGEAVTSSAEAGPSCWHRYRRGDALKVEWQSVCKHCTCQLITGASARQQSCCQDGRRVLGAGVNTSAFCCIPRIHYTARRSCQELPVPLSAKSFNKGLNLSNQTDIDCVRPPRFWEQQTDGIWKKKKKKLLKLTCHRRTHPLIK